jgi:hypothetical protein
MRSEKLKQVLYDIDPSLIGREQPFTGNGDVSM